MKDTPFFFYKEMKLLLFICNWMRIFKSSTYLGIKNEFVMSQRITLLNEEKKEYTLISVNFGFYFQKKQKDK